MSIEGYPASTSVYQSIDAITRSDRLYVMIVAHGRVLSLIINIIINNSLNVPLPTA